MEEELVFMFVLGVFIGVIIGMMLIGLARYIDGLTRVRRFRKQEHQREVEEARERARLAGLATAWDRGRTDNAKFIGSDISPINPYQLQLEELQK